MPRFPSVRGVPPIEPRVTRTPQAQFHTRSPIREPAVAESQGTGRFGPCRPRSGATAVTPIPSLGLRPAELHVHALRRRCTGNPDRRRRRNIPSAAPHTYSNPISSLPSLRQNPTPPALVGLLTARPGTCQHLARQQPRAGPRFRAPPHYMYMCATSAPGRAAILLLAVCTPATPPPPLSNKDLGGGGDGGGVDKQQGPFTGVLLVGRSNKAPGLRRGLLNARSPL